MTLLFASVLGGALAAGPGDTLIAMMAEHGATDMALSCAPFGALVEQIREMPGGTGEGLPPEVARLFSAEGSAAAGLDLDGALGMGISPDAESGWFVLPFRGGGAEAEALLGSLNLEPYALGGDRWELRAGKAEASLAPGGVLIRMGSELTGPTPEPALFQGLPEGSGCTMWMIVPERPTTAQVGPMRMAAWFPLREGEQAILRLSMKAQAPQVLSRAQSAPVGGSSSEPPTIVASLGVSLSALLQDEDIVRAMELDERKARKATRALDVGSGTTLAIFGEPRPRDLSWAAVVPLEHTRRPAAVARRGRRAFKRLGYEIDRGTRTAFVARQGETLLYAASAEGRLAVGSDPVRVTEAASGSGRSWLEGANLERMQGWPIAVWTGPGLARFEDVPEGLSLDLGLRARDGIWEIGLRMKGWPNLLEAILQDGPPKSLPPGVLPL